MIEWLNNIDIELMVFLNSFNNEYFDHVFWMISGKLTWIPLYLTVIAILFRKRYNRSLNIVCHFNVFCPLLYFIVHEGS